MTNIQVSVYGVREEADGTLKGLGQDKYGTHYKFSAPEQDLRRIREEISGKLGPEVENPDYTKVEFPAYDIDIEAEDLEAGDQHFSEIDSTRPARKIDPDSVDSIGISN